MRARQADLGEVRGRARIEEHGGLVDLVDAQNAFELDLDRAVERAPHRDAELIAPHIGESGGDELLAERAARLAVLAVAIENQRLGLVAAEEPLDRGDISRRRRVGRRRNVLGARDVAGHVFGALAGIEHDGAAVGEDAPHLLGADFLGLLVGLAERRLMDVALRGCGVDRQPP